MRAFVVALAVAAGSCLVLPAAAQAPTPPAVTELSLAMARNVDRLIEAAHSSTVAWELVEGVTTEIGPRLAGSPEEAAARAWAVRRLKALGFSNVRIEPFEVPYWRRTFERAEIVSGPTRQRLVLAALGTSAPTPQGGIEAEVVRFPSMAALQAAADDAVKGKIVFIDERMVRTTDGSGYGPAQAKRRLCAPESLKKGAAACLIRSVGTHTHRFPHQGGSGADHKIPAAALSPPDADQITRLLKSGPVRLRLEIGVEARAAAPSGNVIAEIPGSGELKDEIVLVGGHLDSWDQGTGAVDDGAGIAITAAAAKLVGDLPGRPRRTIRVVFWGSEETGVYGAAAYAKAHADEAEKHVVAAESDFGAGRVYAFGTRFGEAALPHARAMQRALAPLMIVPGPNTANGGPDVGALRALGVPVVDLEQDGTDYFDYHHTPDDTLDKIEPEALKQNVAAWAVFIYLASDTGWTFR